MATYFKPAGIPMHVLESVTLSLEEVEAIRLKDTGDMHQEECARQMGVSRATFHQIIKSARGKLADAIVNGKAIRVEGGSVAFPGGRFRCRQHGHEWVLPPGPLPGASSVTCPTCNSRDVQPMFPAEPGWHGDHVPGQGPRGRRGRHGAWAGSDGVIEEQAAPRPGRHGRRGGRG